MRGGSYRGKELHPALDAGLVFGYFADLLEAFVIRLNQEKHAEYVTAKATDTPHNASGFEFHGGTVPFFSKFCSINIDDGADRAVRLFLFERCSQVIGASIAMQAERSILVFNSLPIWEEKCRWSCEFRKDDANDLFHRVSKVERGFFLD